jgi:hypothetical protein
MRAADSDVFSHGESSGQGCRASGKQARGALHSDPLKVQLRYPSDNGGARPANQDRMGRANSKARACRRSGSDDSETGYQHAPNTQSLAADPVLHKPVGRSDVVSERRRDPG